MNEIVSNLNTGSLALLFEVYVIFNFIYWLNSFLINISRSTHFKGLS